jgi:hypothetical protein
MTDKRTDSLLMYKTLGGTYYESLIEFVIGSIYLILQYGYHIKMYIEHVYRKWKL